MGKSLEKLVGFVEAAFGGINFVILLLFSCMLWEVV